jgi:hypothetical protein
MIKTTFTSPAAGQRRTSGAILVMKAKKRFHPSRFSILPPAARAMAEAIARTERTPETLAGCCVLGFLSASIGAGLEVTSGPNRVTRANLYIMASAESGSGKSETFRHAAKPFYDYEREMVERWQAKVLPGLQAEKDLLESEIAKLKKMPAKANPASNAKKSGTNCWRRKKHWRT